MKTIADRVSETDGHEGMTDEQMDRTLKSDIQSLVKEYSNMADVDLATKGVEKSEQLVKLAEGNLNKLANNMDDLERLHGVSKKTVTQAMERSEERREC